MRMFKFGDNWLSFSRTALSGERLESARSDFGRLTKNIDLAGKTFLDIGFGQGLALHFAMEHGATVTGCDIDEVCFRAASKTSEWFDTCQKPRLIHGSILAESTMRELQLHAADGYDVVHSWGVLHHTGAMKQSIANACSLTRKGGYLIIAIYNRHWSSFGWKKIKWLYNGAPDPVKKCMIALFVPIISLAKAACLKKVSVKKERGMDFMHDLIDWVGGYPYEYATAEEVTALLCSHGFALVKKWPPLVPTGCNEFVFCKEG